MAFQVSRLGGKKKASHIILLLLINEEREKTKYKVMSHLNVPKPDVELRNRHRHALMRKYKVALASLKKECCRAVGLRGV